MKKELLKLFKNKSIVFLENGTSLDDLGINLSSFLKDNNIKFDCIFEVEKLGLQEVLKRCRSVELIIFHTTWVYPVSKQLKEAFMSIKNKEFKKSFVELYVHEPTFYSKPKTIHDMYILNSYDADLKNWDFYRL
jgi:hypothetical protein